MDGYKDLVYDRFDAFFANLMVDEGGYVPQRQARIINDPGGATIYGISLRFLKSCGINVGDLNHDGVIDAKDIVMLTQDQAKELYFLYFWNPLYDKILNVQLANRIFNFGVNAGKVKSVLSIQQAVNDTLQGSQIEVDGVFGNGSLEAVNGLQTSSLYNNYILRIANYYKSLNKPQFLNGWLNRLKRLITPAYLRGVK